MTVFVLGNAALDFVQQVDRLPLAGETLVARNALRCAGGKGLNQALMAARTGVPTELTAPLGRDKDGAFIKDTLGHEPNLRTNWLEVESPTDVSVVWTVPGGTNSIVTSAQAATSFKPADAEQALAAIGPDDLLLLQGNLPLAATRRALELATAQGATTMLNTAPLVLQMTPLLEYCDVVLANAVEAATLADTDPSRAARALQRGRTRAAIVTVGKDGAVLCADGEVSALPAPNVPIRDTSGAGDVLTGVLAALLAKGLPAREAVCKGLLAASRSVTRAGTSQSFPSAAELVELGVISA